MITEEAILIFQSIATIFMATDYFFDEKQRVKINLGIEKVISPMQNRVSDNAIRLLEIAIQNSLPIIGSVMILIIWMLFPKFITQFPIIDQHWFIVVVVLILILTGFLFFAIKKLTDSFISILIPLLINTSMSFVLNFLIRCPKGTVFGIGFVFLVFSFICRWYNLFTKPLL